MYDEPEVQFSRREPFIGMLVGALLGVSVVSGYFWQAMLVGLFGVCGLLAGLAIMWIRKNPENLVNAWKSLRNEDR